MMAVLFVISVSTPSFLQHAEMLLRAEGKSPTGADPFFFTNEICCRRYCIVVGTLLEFLVSQWAFMRQVWQPQLRPVRTNQSSRPVTDITCCQQLWNDSKCANWCVAFKRYSQKTQKSMGDRFVSITPWCQDRSTQSESISGRCVSGTLKPMGEFAQLTKMRSTALFLSSSHERMYPCTGAVYCT